MKRVEPEDICEPEWADWYRLTPAERWEQSARLWATYTSLGGTLDPDPDTQSPFNDPEARREVAADGGQACIFYGAAEFSRDTDLVILASTDNLGRLSAALDELLAEVIAVPPFDRKYLDKGHSIHFSCRRPDVKRMRLDVMSKMRGVDAFPSLWERRTTATIDGMGELDIIALPDLVAAKKTQRDKDWPMVRRLVEANYFAFRDEPSPERIRFWLMELRTPELLVEVVRTHPSEVADSTQSRTALEAAVAGDVASVERSLAGEEAGEREADRQYWAPLRAELEALRHELRKQKAASL